jgi:hypothetical protein
LNRIGDYFRSTTLVPCTKRVQLRVDGVERCAGIYPLEGLIHKRYVMTKGGKEHAMACAARLETLHEFEERAQPVFDDVVPSLKLL